MASEAALADCISVLEDVIQSRQDADNQHDPSPSDFFGIIVTLLGTGATEEKTGLMLQILAAVIPKTNSNLIQSYFKPVFQALGKIIQSTDESPLIESCLTCLGLLLKEQDTSDGFWNGLPALQATNTLLTFIDSEPRLRKATFRALQQLGEHHNKHKALAFRSYLGEFVQGVFKEATRTNYRRAHCVVVFLESALPLIPDTQTKRVVDAALKLQDCSIPRLTAAVYRMIDSFLQSPGLRMTAAGARSMVKLLLQHYPSTQDVETHCHYISALASSLVSQHETSSEAEPELLQRSLSMFQRSLDSEFTQVHVAVAAGFKRIAFSFVSTTTKTALQTYLSTLNIEVGSILDVTGSSVPHSASIIRELVQFTVTTMQLPYALAWMQVMDCIRAIFQLFRGQAWASCVVAPLITVLGDVYTALENQVLPNIPESIHKALLETLGTSLQCAGLKKFLSLMPLIDTSSSAGGTEIAVSRDWLIHLLHEHLSHTTMKLSEFVTVILPLAQTFHQIVQRAQQAIATAEAKQETGPGMGTLRKRVRIFRDKVMQVWSLFPEICAATLLDIPTSVPKIVPILQTAMQDENYPDISFHITVGVHRWIADSNNNPTQNLLAHRAIFESVAPSLLPLLLQAIEKVNMGDSKFKETLDCITNWIGIAPASVLTSITKRLLQVVLTHTGTIDDMDPEAQRQQQVAAIWMAVLNATVAKAPANIVLVMYKTVKPLLSLTAEAHSLQKRAYQLLHALLEERSDVIAQMDSLATLLQLLVSSLPTAHASSRNVRMRCIATVLQSLEDVELITQACNELGNEVLNSLKDANRKTRVQAIEILKVLTVRLPWETLFAGFAAPLTAANPTSTLTKSASITALCVLLMEYASKRFHLNDGAEDEDMDTEQLESQLQMYQQSCLGIISGGLSFLEQGLFSQMVQEETSDQTKAILSFLKLMCAFGTRDLLQSHLPRMLYLLANELGSLKHKFSARIRAVYRKLLRKFDGDLLRTVVPATDMALLDYLLRLQRKRLRRQQKLKNSGNSNKDAANKKKQEYYDRLMNSDSEDDEEEEDEDEDMYDVDAKTDRFTERMGGSTVGRRSVAAGTELRSAIARSILGSVQLNRHDRGEDSDEEGEGSGAVDAEDYRLMKKKHFVATRSRVGGKSTTKSVRGSGEIDQMMFMPGEEELDAEYYPQAAHKQAVDRFELVLSEDGKLVVRANGMHGTNTGASSRMDADDEDEVDEGDELSGSGKMRRLLQAKNQQQQQQQHWREQKKLQKQGQQKKKFNLRDPGADYRAKNAGGDVWKKGSLQPHAYIPLDPRLLSKKHKNLAVEHFGQVVNNNTSAGRKKLKLKNRK